MPSSDIIIYQNSDGNIKIDVRLEDELALDATCRKFRQVRQKGARTVPKHIQNVFAEGELVNEVVCRVFRQTTEHGAKRLGKYAA